MIEAKSLSKSYEQVPALQEASFSIGAGEVVGLLGPNGAGKSTLMKILTGYLHPSGGSAVVDGIDVLADPLAVQSRIGYLPENAPVYPDMVVQEYLQFVADLRELGADQRGALIGEAVRRTGLESHLVRPIGELSKGYRQRVGLAQAILHRPRVLILDEATSGLDPTQIVEIRALIKSLAKQATVLLSTHILPEVELTCERVLVINEGRVFADARLDALRSRDVAVARIDAHPDQARPALERITGVSEVRVGARVEGFTSFRVTGSGEHGALCPKIYDIARQQGWRLAELRDDPQTLESVFRSIVEGRATAGASTEAGAAA